MYIYAHIPEGFEWCRATWYAHPSVLIVCKHVDIYVYHIYIYMYNWLRNRMKLALLAARETNCDPSIELRLVAELPHDVSTLEHLFTGQNHEGFRLSQAKL